MELCVVLTVPDFDTAVAFTATPSGSSSSPTGAPPAVPPWGGRNARLRTPDGMQLTLFGEP